MFVLKKSLWLGQFCVKTTCINTCLCVDGSTRSYYHVFSKYCTTLSNLAYMSAPGAHDRHEPVERVAALRHRLRAEKLQRQCGPEGHQHKVQLNNKQEDDLVIW